MNQIRHIAFRRGPSLGGDLRAAFDHIFGSEISAQSTPTESAWSPRVDIREEDARFLILADLPGVELADVEIQMDKNVLGIKGERKAYNGTGEGKYARVERVAGAFRRSFTLPDSADADGITASGRNGVLEIAIPKKAESAPRRITINVAG